MHTLPQYFPVWDKLDPLQKQSLLDTAAYRAVPEGTVLQNGSADCVGLFVLCSGQLRAYILSDEGKEITLYRLFERDICLFSGSCILSDIQFDIIIEAEKETELWIIPASVYQQLMQSSADVSNYTNKLMASRFSDVMWLINQVLFKSFDARLASFLIDESELEGCETLKITHEKIARHLGTAREVVSRMLKYFQSENMVHLSRGGIRIINQEKLSALTA